MGREACQADYEGINGVDEGKPEMEFLNSIFQSRILGINSSLLRLEFLAGFLYPHFSVLQTAVHE